MRRSARENLDAQLGEQFLREALFPSGSDEKLMSVRPLVNKIIDFCEEDLEGGTRLLSTGSLSL